MLESFGFIQDILHHLNYFWVMVLMAIESSFIPFPSEVVVPPAAYKAATGEMDLFLVILFATIGSDIGALVNYYLAKYLGRPIVYKFAASRLGRLCLLSPEKVEKAEGYFVKNGVTSTLDPSRSVGYARGALPALYDHRGRCMECRPCPPRLVHR